MAKREVILKAALQAAQNLEADQNEGSRLQKQIDLLATEVAFLLKSRKSS